MTATSAPTLPIGFEPFARDKFLNYQLNRWHSQGYARTEDLRAAGARIKSFDDYRREFRALAEAAEDEARWSNAFSYWRAAEFLEPPGPDKLRHYEAAIAAFDRAFSGDGITRHEVAWGDGKLSALHMPPLGAEPLGETVLVMGGFDSLIEEFYAIWGSLARRGFDVIAFEGPGQGGTLKRHQVTFDHRYEGPVGALLDHFGCERAALMGISMGGWWAARAAAFEPRIDRLVLNPPVYDWLAQVGGFTRGMVRVMLKWRWLMRLMVRLKMKLAAVIRHAVSHAMYITGSDDPMGAIDWMLGMNAAELHSDRIRCDVLLTAGEHDSFQPPVLMERQRSALTQARSVTTRTFTAAEHADQHCQMGNLQLSIDVMAAWLLRTGPSEPRSRQEPGQ